jgi:hypothetical protein
MAGWENREYDVLFANHPPTEPTAPTADECDALGAQLDRSRGAILAQWDDARSLILGQKSAASEQLGDYVRARGWLDRWLTRTILARVADWRVRGANCSCHIPRQRVIGIE